MTVYKSCIIYVICSLLIDNFCYGSTVDKKYKIILIGGPAVGKTSLITQLTQKTFEENTIMTLSSGDNISYTYTSQKGTEYKFNIWDTAGQDSYRTANKVFYKNANGIMAVYDITNQKSLGDLSDRIKDAFECVGQNTPMIIVANKSDLYDNQVVNKDTGEEFASRYDGSIFVETSAKDHESVEEAFKALFEKVIAANAKKAEEQEENNTTVPPEKLIKKEKIMVKDPMFTENEIKKIQDLRVALAFRTRQPEKKKTCRCCPCWKKKEPSYEDDKQIIIPALL